MSKGGREGGREGRTRQEITELPTIVLPERVKHNGARGHIHTHGKGLGGEENLDEALGEEDFDDFLGGRGREGGRDDETLFLRSSLLPVIFSTLSRH